MDWSGSIAVQVLRAEWDWNWLVRKEKEKLSIRLKVRWSAHVAKAKLFSGTNHWGIIKVLIKYANKTAELILFC